MKENKTLISPSLLSADFTRLGEEVEMINQSQADWLHIDVMDGVFVPNISFGFPVLNALKPICQKPLDVHLMIVNPTQYVDAFRNAGAEILCIHQEAVTHLDRAIHQIQDAGMKAGVAINPMTPIATLEHAIEVADMLLVMSVNPGFGAQKFIPYCVDKVAALKETILRKNSHAIIQVDGGVNLTTGRQLVDAGADCLVAGNFVFAAENPHQQIIDLKAL